jgi:serine/threonine protein kinase
VCESESPNLHDPSARIALCVCAVKQRKETSSLDSTPILLHPYLLRQFAATENYIFTEHCPLGSLEEYLQPDTIVPVVAWATQLCSALSYLRSEGFAHGRLVPSSVQVAEGGKSLRLGNLESVVRFAGTPPDLDAHACDDVYKLGCLFLFIENGGKPNKDHTMPVSVQSLQLGDPISRCWAGVDVRPSSHKLLEVLQSFGPLDGGMSIRYAGSSSRR